MWHLVRAELHRYRRTALWLGLLHAWLLLLGLALDRSPQSAPQTVPTLLLAALLGYGLLGVVLGSQQVGGYRRHRLWTFLLHRPLRPSQVLHALLLAATCALLLALALPWLGLGLGLEWGTAAGVDLRHWLLLPLLFGHVLVCYLLGLLLALGRQRANFLILAVPLLYLGLPAAGWWSGLVLLAVLVGLYFLVRAAFQPAVDPPPGVVGGPSALVLAGRALAVQVALFGLLGFAAKVAYSTVVAVQEHGWRSFSQHSWNEYFDEGTYARLSYLSGGASLAHGLRLSDSPRARQLLAELEARGALEASVQRTVRWPRPAAWQQPVFQDDSAGAFVLDPAGIVWTFHHDHGVFYGRDERDQTPRGWLGLAGRATTPEAAGRFPEVPRGWGESQVTRRRVYSYDPRHQAFELDFDLGRERRPADSASSKSADEEVLIAPLVEYDSHASVLSNRAFYVLTPGGRTYALPWPEAPRHLLHVVVAPRGEGSFVVGFAYGRLSERGLGPARQIVGVLQTGGDFETPFETIVDLPLRAGPPTWLRYWDFIQAPLLLSGHDLGRALLLDGQEDARLRDLLRRVPPWPILLAALLTALSAATLTHGLARRRGLPPPSVRTWTLITAATGLPGLCSFLLLTRSD